MNHYQEVWMKIGIISFSDGRKRVAEATTADCLRFQGEIAKWLRSKKYEAIEGQEIIWNHETYRSMAKLMNIKKVDICIFNFAVWSYPDFSVQAAELINAPILFTGVLNPGYPGWVAFFASAGALDEVGIPFGRALGNIKEKSVQKDIITFIEQHDPGRRKKGQEMALNLHDVRYGEFDGPSMGMYTGHIDQSQWKEQFGIHVFHRSQLTLVQNMKKISDSRVKKGLDWLEEHTKKIHWDGKMLTPGLDGTLARQVRLYLSTKDFCKQEGIDFCGITGQLDLTEYEEFCTADVTEALLNDNTDWENPRKKPIPCATECDSNGALTMFMLFMLTDKPVLFADLRHYHENLDLYDLTNSGQHAPYLSKYSDDWRKNWGEVELMPASKFYFVGGGASVKFFSDACKPVTFARLTRKTGQYRMHMFTGEFLDVKQVDRDKLAKMTTYEWPHAFARFNCPYSEFKKYFSCNHIHAAPGDHIAELMAACEVLGIEPVVMG